MFRVDGLTDRIRAQNFFSIELEDQTKHTVSSRMLRTIHLRQPSQYNVENCVHSPKVDYEQAQAE